MPDDDKTHSSIKLFHMIKELEDKTVDVPLIREKLEELEKKIEQTRVSQFGKPNRERIEELEKALDDNNIFHTMITDKLSSSWTLLDFRIRELKEVLRDVILMLDDACPKSTQDLLKKLDGEKEPTEEDGDEQG